MNNQETFNNALNEFNNSIKAFNSKQYARYNSNGLDADYYATHILTIANEEIGKDFETFKNSVTKLVTENQPKSTYTTPTEEQIKALINKFDLYRSINGNNAKLPDSILKNEINALADQGVNVTVLSDYFNDVVTEQTAKIQKETAYIASVNKYANTLINSLNFHTLVKRTQGSRPLLSFEFSNVGYAGLCALDAMGVRINA